MTGAPELQNDIRNAGGNWVDQDVTIDGNLISSRSAADIAAFAPKMIDVFAARMQANLRGTPDENTAGLASS